MRIRVLLLSSAFVLLAGSPCLAQVAPAAGSVADSMAGKCMTCHKKESPGLYRQWYMSEHAKHNVTCIGCHGAPRGDADAYLHEGAYIATLVTPRDCGRCHQKETREAEHSYHATAGEILESADAYLAHAAGGHPVAIAGCESCHGAKIQIDAQAENRLARVSWPNSGIGRLNPDGSKGACNACHTRHSFSKAQARRPESCGKCHLGPDHPQKEVYEESKHGNAYYTHIDDMNLAADRWVVGIDYYEAPTCATCHMSATSKQPLTHDVGQRISWTLRPKISHLKEDWEVKRKSMQQVCAACHHEEFIAGHYFQMDGVVQVYNEKFARPAGEIMGMIEQKGLRENPSAFGNKIDWIYWELWHHEGRRARHGAAMMGPDYTWWHGIYDVAQNFYFEFLPEARRFEDPEINAHIDRLLSEDPMHQWIRTPTAETKAAIRSGELQENYRGIFKPE
ncbi:MAG: hypothetical protein KAY32_14845 [Candidatus Eisenbacteria sp.]|nr:hypothetical protein [Candidatus Eisenbacteria bacterium]